MITTVSTTICTIIITVTTLSFLAIYLLTVSPALSTIPLNRYYSYHPTTGKTAEEV